VPAAGRPPADARPLRPVLVLGLDGATFDVIRPLAAAGRLPHLARWMEAGAWAPLASTVPPMTFPAWSTFLTGLGPGRHGLFDFTQKLPGAWRIRFTNASDRRGASVFARVSRAGGRVLALGMPATWPPEAVDGLLVPGFDAPVSRGTDPARTSDPGLYRAVAERAGPWMTPDLDETARDGGWHEHAARVLVARVERKKRFALEALRILRSGGRPVDLACVVFAESDTVAHHFWRDHDPVSPRHDPRASAARRGAVAAVYEALDAACGELREAFGPDALCIVVSDHGSGGAADKVVHPNARLAECGLLQRRQGAAAGLDRAARAARDAALRVLPPRAAEALFRRVRAGAAAVESAARFGGVDWARTAAVSEETNTQPGVWINLGGREAGGCVAPGDYERVRSEVIEALESWRLPGSDAPVVARARRREEVYVGPLVGRAPDVVFEPGSEAGYGLAVVPTPWGRLGGPGPGAARGAGGPVGTAGARAATGASGASRTSEMDEATGATQTAQARPSVTLLRGEALAGGRGRGMNGLHRPEGILVAHGPGFEGGALAGGGAPGLPGLADLAPTLLRALGVAWDEHLDGAALAPAPYTAEEEAQVAARLRALGYLD